MGDPDPQLSTINPQLSPKMPRKKTTPPTFTPAPDNSGFDVPPLAPAPPAKSPGSAPVAPPLDQTDSESEASLVESPPASHATKPTPVNATAIVKVPKQSFLRLQRMQTEKAKQEQLRQLARRHPVVREAIQELESLRAKVEAKESPI